jgi:hypothetical protein
MMKTKKCISDFPNKIIGIGGNKKSKRGAGKEILFVLYYIK